MAPRPVRRTLLRAYLCDLCSLVLEADLLVAFSLQAD